MATLTDISDAVTEIESTMAELKVQADQVQVKLDELVAGQPVTQEQLDALNERVNALKSSAQSILSQVDDMA